MPTRTTIQRLSIPFLATALCALHSVILFGCAAGGGADLARLAQRQERTRDSRAQTAPPPPGVDIERLALVDPSDTIATSPLEGTIDAFLARAATTEPPEDTDGQVSDRAVRLYVSGRSKRLGGDLRGAVADLQAALELDRESASIWRELAEAQYSAGDGLTAVAAFREALQRDPQDVRSLLIVGLAEAERRDYERAAMHLSRAWRLARDADAALPYVLGAALGRTFFALGYTAAGEEAMRIAADLPESFTQPTAYTTELTGVYRTQAEMWRDIGDACARLGRFGEAADAYLRASRYPTFNPGSLMPRLVYVSMRSGEPAAAAQFVLGNLRMLGWRADDRHVRLIRHISANSGVGRAVHRELVEAEASLSEEERALAHPGLVRARAASLPFDEAEPLLLERIRRAPRDEKTVQVYFDRLTDEAPERLIEATAELIEASPMQEATYTDALVRSETGIEAILDRALASNLRTESPIGGALLIARLQMRAGRPSEALQIALPEAPPPPATAAAIALQSEAMLASGDAENAMAALERLPDDDDAMRARSRILRSIGRYDAALTAMRPLADASEPDPLDLLIIGQLHALLEEYDEADSSFRRAIEIDPAFEQAHAALISLYGVNGPIADREVFAELLAALRQIAPSSRTIRWLRAQELMGARQYGEAERELLSLAEEQTTASIASLLTTVWLRTGSADRAERWLEEKREQRPADPIYVEQLARVLAATDRAEEAANLLYAALGQRPAENSLSRMLESILRDDLERPIEADNLALRRLMRSPQSLNRSIDLANILVRRDDYVAAAEALTNALALPDPVRDNQRGQLVEVSYLIADNAVTTGDNTVGASALLETLAERVEPLPSAVHEQRLALLVQHDADVTAILDVLHQGLAGISEDAPLLYLRALQMLESADRLPDALVVIEDGAAKIKAPPLDLLLQWLQIAVNAEDVESMMEVVDRIHAGDLALEMLTRIPNFQNQWRRAETQEQAACDIAYALGTFVSDNQESAMAMYRFALRYDPRHAMANNNLAYVLTLRGEDLEEAHAMLQLADEQLPGNGAITDSLGWVRYKIGLLADVKDENGDIAIEGAVTLLQRASDMADARDDPIVHDHLGDALWRTGQRESAKREWTAALALANTQINAGAVNEELQRVQRNLREKIDAVDAGEEPPVAPLGEGYSSNYEVVPGQVAEQSDGDAS